MELKSPRLVHSIWDRAIGGTKKKYVTALLCGMRTPKICAKCCSATVQREQSTRNTTSSSDEGWLR